MNNLPRKKLFDDNGVLIKEGDIVKVSKLAIGQGGILLKAKYDQETEQWLFYSGGFVAYTWEDLHLSQVKSVVVIDNKSEKE